MRGFPTSSRAWLLAAALFLGLGTPVAAQTVLTSTTLAASVTDTSTRAIALTSASGFSAGGATAQTYVLVDREIMLITGVSGTTLSVIRGYGGTRASAHLSGATATFVPQAATIAYVPAGYCVATAYAYAPLVIHDGQDEVNNGATAACLGSQWVLTNRVGLPVYGSTVASATTIAATGTYFKVSGTTTIQTVTVPAGWAPGMSLLLEPTALWSTNTSGNIGLATTGVVGKVLILTWNGTKWQPSY